MIYSVSELEIRWLCAGNLSFLGPAPTAKWHPPPLLTFPTPDPHPYPALLPQFGAFEFDAVYEEGTTQSEVFRGSVQPLLNQLYQGLDSMIFLYGKRNGELCCLSRRVGVRLRHAYCRIPRLGQDLHPAGQPLGGRPGGNRAPCR